METHLICGHCILLVVLFREKQKMARCFLDLERILVSGVLHYCMGGVKLLYP